MVLEQHIVLVSQATDTPENLSFVSVQMTKDPCRSTATYITFHKLIHIRTKTINDLSSSVSNCQAQWENEHGNTIQHTS